MAAKIIFRGQISPIMSAIRMGGDVMRISFDVPLMERINAIGLLALTDQPLLVTIEPDKTAATPQPKEKGIYSEFWRLMVVKGVKTYPDLQEVLDCTPERVWDALHAAFETETMSTVSPRQFEQFVKDNGLSEGLITMSRNAEAKAAEKQGALVS
jgi:hypothetical protein